MINNPILNKTGLACLLWTDKPRDILRRRLESKFNRKKLTESELNKISEYIEQLKIDFNNFKNENTSK